VLLKEINERLKQMEEEITRNKNKSAPLKAKKTVSKKKKKR
jgi:hypothetical protein